MKPSRVLGKFHNDSLSLQAKGPREGGPLSTDTDLTILLVAYNEADAIRDTLRRILALGCSPQRILVVDDGSKDRTAELAMSYQVRLVRHGANRGKAEAFRTGLAHATGEILVTMDADGQDPPEEIPRLAGAMTDGIDMVNGSKFSGTCAPGAISHLNAFGNRFMTSLTRILHGANVTDSQSGFRAFRRSKLLELPLHAYGYGLETEVLLEALHAGWEIREIPVRRDARAAGRSKFRRFRDGWRILKLILSRHSPFLAERIP